VTALSRAGHKRSARTGRRALVAFGAALALLPFGAGSASAQSFIDPADPCIGDPPPAQFADRDQIIPVHLLNVDCAVFRGIANGVERDGQRFYNPAQSIPRDQMASLIMRTLVAAGYQLPAPQDTGFSDVDEDSVHAPAISQLKQIGVTLGTSETTYSPSNPVQRDQMASFLVRAAEFAYEGDMLDGQVVEPPTFVDVLPTNVHRENIFAAVRLIGVAEGKSDTMYNPNDPTRRDQMASFVVRLLDVTILPDVAVERQAEAGE
jgi:hypothetical protein